MHAHNFKDLSGQRFGLLTAVKCVGVVKSKTRWECICDCGETSVKVYQHLVLGLTKSCGCFRKKYAAEKMRKMVTTHGLSVNKWWSNWHRMMDRCYNKKSARYASYGGRGISVCERWHDAALFHEDMGDRPEGKSLDRINNDGNYSPENCKWSTYIEQNNNRRTTKIIEFNGESLSGAQWARKLGVSKGFIYHRLKTMTVEKALTLRHDVQACQRV